MDKSPNKSFKIGNTSVTIYSPLMNMTADERKEWFDLEWEKENPILKEIVERAAKCLKDNL